MAKQKKAKCGLKGCENNLQGGAEVGYTMEGELRHVMVCARHAWILMTSEPGMWRITEDLSLEAIPKKLFFT